MKSYNNNYSVNEIKSNIFFEIVYNNEDTIDMTNDYNEAIKKAKECAKCNENDGDFYVVNAIQGENIIHIVSYHIHRK